MVRGIPEGVSAVTVMGAMAPRQIMNEWTKDPREILETFAAEMRANQRHYSIYGGNYAIIIPKQLRDHIQDAGWSKRDIAEFIYERARIRRAEWTDVGKGAVVRDRGETVHTALDVAGSSARRRGRRPGRRLWRRHRAMVRQQDQSRHGRDRRLCRLRAAERLKCKRSKDHDPSRVRSDE